MTTMQMPQMPTSFWWDRVTRPRIDIPDLAAVVFSLDAVLDGTRRDDDAFRDLVWDLHCAGRRIAIVTERHRTAVHRSVRDLLGDGAVEVMITGDEVGRGKPDPEIYHHALWELGLRAEQAMAVEDSAAGLSAALGAGLATAVVTTDADNDGFTGATAVLSGYDRLSVQPLWPQAASTNSRTRAASA